MAATAYSSLVSLMNVLTKYQHPNCLVEFDQSKIQTLIDKVGTLADFLERKTSNGSIHRKMTRAAHAAEDVVESYYVRRVIERRRIQEMEESESESDHSMGREEIIQESREVDHSMGSFLSLSTHSNQTREESGSMAKHLEEHGTKQNDPLALTLSPVSQLPNPNEVVDVSISTPSSSFPRDENVMEAHAAEDVVESYYVRRVLDMQHLTDPYDIILSSDLEKAIQEMEEIIQESREVGVKKHKSESDHSMGSFLSLSTHSNQTREESGSMPKHLEEHGTKQNDPLALTLSPVSQLPNPNEVVDVSISTPSSSFPRDENVMEAVATNLNEIANTETSLVHAHFSSRPRDKDFMVGFDKQFNRLMDQIRIPNQSLKIIPIVGMGGIGKTTLATNVYNSKYAHHHFDIRAWVTISQQYVVKNIIVSLLRDIKVEGNDQMDDEQLKDKLYQGLRGRRYLIVLDDIWDIQPWNEIRRLFPDQGNGSRILLTTRDHNVAYGVGSSSTYEMEFLDDDESFNLLSKKVYGPKVFPLEMEILGKKIAKSCKGLPLAVAVIGGLLKTCSETLEYWNEFAENLSSVISKENGGQCLGILSLSYGHLPIHLKPCFLHMATFREDEKINVPSLINLWIAEGFFKPTKDRMPGEIALEYLTDLIDRNLIMVAERRWSEKIETVSMHDLVRELCLEEAKNEDFLCVLDADTPNLKQRLECERRIVYKHVYAHSYSKKVFISSSMLHARSLNVTSWQDEITSVCGLSRVINIPGYFPSETEFANFVNISYLAVKVGERLSCSWSLFRNLETLILYSSNYYKEEEIYLPSEIWEFPHLRHLEFKDSRFLLKDPTGGQSNKNMQTIRGVINFYFTDVVFSLIPNLKELTIGYHYDEYDDDDDDDLQRNDDLQRSFTSLALFPKLEILEVYFLETEPQLWLTSFSPNLVELELSGCSYFPWEDMTIVGCLPSLQVLGLGYDAFFGDEWNPIEGEFQSLKYLSIDCCRLRTWNAERCHFPRLEHLELLDVRSLKKIPLEIGDIQSLECIKLYSRKISLLISAKEIFEERSNNEGGGDEFLVKGYYIGGQSEELEEVKEWAQTHKNFQIKWE